mgnify:CR=1 FL=1
MRKKSKRSKRLIWLAVITLLTALIWTALDSYHQLVKREQTEKVESLIKPLDPQLNAEILELIEGRKEYQIEEVKIKLPVPTDTPGKIATKSGEGKK